AGTDAESLAVRAERLAETAARLSRAELADLAAALQRELEDGPARAAVVAGKPAEAAERLRRLASRLRRGDTVHLDPRHGIFLGAGVRGRRIGFLFPGQGAPSHLDGGLLRRRFEDLAAFYEDALLVPPTDAGGVVDAVNTAVAQPAILAHSLAGLRLLDRLGLRAGVAVGHSLGEIAALQWGGALDAGSALRLAAELAAIPFRPLSRPVASTVLGSLLTAATDLPALLCGQLTAPVRFTEALAAADRVDLWIEVGPGRALSELVGEVLNAPAVPLDVGGPSIAGVLAAAGAAFALGVPVATAVLFEGRFTRPFDRDRPLKFLANPCEMAPLIGAVTGEITGAAPLPASPRVRGEEKDRGEDAGLMVPSPLRGEAGRGLLLTTPREVLRQLVAERAELPLDSVQDGSHLLSDLHLNSISVGQLVVEAARRLGLRPPSSPTDYARATVAEVAEALSQQAPLIPGAASEPAAPAGVDSWVRPFTVELVERPLPRHGKQDAAGAGGWRVVAPPHHPLAGPLAAAFASQLPGSGVALLLPVAVDERHAGLFVEAAQAALAAPGPLRFALIQQGGVGGGFARTLHQEIPGTATCVVELPFDHPGAAAWVAAEIAAAATGYVEAHYDAEGVRRVPMLRLLPAADEPGGELPLGPEDVLLVTGGGKGIASECALDLARETGARLALIGRSLPARDAELAANLERMAAAGVRLLYLPADVTDGEAVRAAVARAEAELGPVTALLHGAGTNVPRPLSALDEASFRHTFAPKAAGLRNVLAAVDPARLRLLVTFGSIIARIGLAGEADYAVANEWLARATERFAGEHPGCRCLTLEWSVWAGVGMGEKLGTLESLMARGISPIPPGTGAGLLRELISAPQPAVSLVVAGRFGEPPTLPLERPDLPLLRYLETPRVYVPGVELVVDAVVSADTDPHLADHVFRGEPLFAAVFGMEAMAQAAMALAGTDEIPVFEDVVFQRPVAVPPGRSTTIRVAALARGPGLVEVVLRDASTGFAADHFRALCRFGAADAADAVDSARPRLLATFPATANGSELIALDPGDLYGGVLFHQGRFQRLRGYRALRATECLAEISSDGSSVWFGHTLPDRLVLGDPGARDAAIHGIQACIPHSTLLPIGVERVVSRGLASDVPLLLAARERSRNGDEFIYDIELVTAGGELRERWEGLKLRAVDQIAPPLSWTAALLGPHVERRLQEIFPGSRVRVALDRDGLDPSDRPGEIRHRPDGRPETGAGNSVSRSHAGGLVLAVTGEGRIGCDLQTVDERTEEVWRDLLGPERSRLAELIVRERGEAFGAAATRVWSAVESLVKAGAPQGAPLVLEDGGLEGAAADGWLLLRSGELRIGTLLAPVRELAGPASLAVLVESVH
ncbi:MAG: SDR family NAD(P)-dependent oxidoreductase, partial [Thermoanaerobaculia bacterium]